MSFAFHKAALLLALLAAAATPALCAPLKVCADPDNFPFSNQHGRGFENQVMDVVARELGRSLDYVWWIDRHAPPTKGLRKRQCDIVPSVLATTEGFATTQPWMRSAYVFVTKKNRAAPAGLDKASIGARTIAVQSVGSEAPTPPAEVLIRNGLSANLRPYLLRTRIPGPTTAQEIVHAVGAGDIDLAVLWGPAAGYYAAHSFAPLVVTVIPTQAASRNRSMTFAVAMAVRNDDTELRESVDRALVTHRNEIARILGAFSVPLVPEGRAP